MSHKIIILGDVHAVWPFMHKLMEHALNEYGNDITFVQVGDFGYYPKNEKNVIPDHRVYKTIHERHIKCYWLDGNHEDHEKLLMDKGAKALPWIYCPRGKALDINGLKCCFMGGAVTPKHLFNRVPYFNWWPQEAINVVDIYEGVKNSQKMPHIDVCFSHDHPECFKYSDKYDFDQESYEARMMLQQLYDAIKPRRWFFGHHHDYATGTHEGCEWHLTPIIESMSYLVYDIESDTVKLVNTRKLPKFTE